MKNIIRIIGYIGGYKRDAVLSVFFNVLHAIFGLVQVTALIPFLNVLFERTQLLGPQPEFSLNVDGYLEWMTYLAAKYSAEYGGFKVLVGISIYGVIASFLKTATQYASLYFLAPLRTGVVKDIRNSVYRKIVDLPLSYYSDERKGDTMARVTSDVQEIQTSIVSSLEAYIKNPILMVVYVSFLISISSKLTLFVFLMLPISGYLIGKVGKNLRKTSFRGQEKLGYLTSIIEETITGLRIIKAFNTEAIMFRKFEKNNSIFTRIITKITRKRGLASPLSEFLGTIVVMSILSYGGYLILSSQSTSLTGSNLIAYIAGFYMIINPAKAFSTAYYDVQKGLASIDRIDKILKADIIIKDVKDATEKKNFDSKIEYRNVSFKYIEEPVLKNIDITINKGRTIALVGQSGSGKSTLVDLLPRLIQLEEGDILIDGISINKIKIKDLRDLMGVVTQQSILFNDTVLNNIAFGFDNVKEEKVIEAAKVANAHEFIMQMPDGYQTNIGDMGGKLSGGQRQRLTIARAIFKNPPILILDEATSALDTESERLVQEALINLMKNRTSIVIAHRLSTIKHADEILVMHEGNIVERGRHDDLLLKEDGFYKRLHELQMT
ncbi:MAG: ABC transporter ATP-binding protein [Bacteroidales bacterium]|nr:ABC transporter ATP-binding protein [Bacteroidales bacterium]